MIEVSVYTTLPECVYELIAIRHPQDGEVIISLLKGRGRLWRIYDSPAHIQAKYKEQTSMYIEALRVEAEIYNLLQAILHTGRTRGRGSDKQGTRRDIDEEDWSKCHINIEKNALLAPPSLPNYRSLWDVQVRLQDVLDGIKPVNGDETDAGDPNIAQTKKEKSSEAAQSDASSPLDLKIQVVAEWIKMRYPRGLRGVAQKVVATEIVADSKVPFDKVSVTTVGRALRLIRSGAI